MIEIFPHYDDPQTWTLFVFLAFSGIVLVEKLLLSTPGGLPWAGVNTELFPRIAGCLRDWKHSMAELKVGYSKFGCKGQFFVKPDIIFRPEIMVPREYLRWVLEQPQTVLSIHEARYEKFALGFVLPEHDDSIDQIFLDTIHHKMTRNLSKLQGDIAKEISLNIDAALGTNTANWAEANVWEMVEKAVFSAIMRILVGNSVCRNDSFRAELDRFTRSFGFSAILVGRILPKWSKPTLGWLLSRLTVIRQRRLVKRWFVPLVEERFVKLSKTMRDPNSNYTPPDDLITWVSEALVKTGNGDRCGPMDLSRRLAIMIPAAVPAIKITTTNAIYDILSCPSETKAREHLYEEIANAFDPSMDRGWADPGLLPRLVLLNSAIRETMRCNPVSVITAERKVSAPGGVSLPSGGQHLPKGTWLGVPVVGVHSDESIYPNASTYQPFRFCSHDPNDKPDGICGTARVTSTGIVNVTDSFLAFGAGKFACPGRWLASYITRLSIAYLIYNYELKPYDQRPLNRAMFGTNMPDRRPTMMVRRRNA